MFRVYQRGADHVWEYVFEEYNEDRYKLEGIDCNDRDYINDLEENDPEYLQQERVDFEAEYAKLSDCEKSYIQGRIDAFNEVMAICQKVSDKKEAY